MQLQLQRLNDNSESTIGILTVDGVFECFTLEDTYNKVKILGHTRIPEGTYDVKLRTEGGMTKRYAEKYSEHKGMLWLQDVDNFDYVYIHIGNNADNTEGCILVGDGCIARKDEQFITGSVRAYKAVYAKVIEALSRNEAVTISIK